jgi:DNA-directed RNA polymerase specialized sigma24 family protein
MTPETAFRNHWAHVVTHARRWGCDDPEAIAAQAFEIYIAKAPDLPDRAVAPWLFTTTMRLCHARRRRRQREAPLYTIHSRITRISDEMRFDQIFEQLVGAAPERNDDLLIALADRLPSMKRAQVVCVLLKAAGWSYTDIARAQGKTLTWVNRHLTEGRAVLRRELAEESNT